MVGGGVGRKRRKTVWTMSKACTRCDIALVYAYMYEGESLLPSRDQQSLGVIEITINAAEIQM